MITSSITAGPEVKKLNDVRDTQCEEAENKSFANVFEKLLSVISKDISEGSSVTGEEKPEQDADSPAEGENNACEEAQAVNVIFNWYEILRNPCFYKNNGSDDTKISKNTIVCMDMHKSDGAINTLSGVLEQESEVSDEMPSEDSIARAVDLNSKTVVPESESSSKTVQVEDHRPSVKDTQTDLSEFKAPERSDSEDAAAVEPESSILENSKLDSKKPENSETESSETENSETESKKPESTKTGRPEPAINNKNLAFFKTPEVHNTNRDYLSINFDGKATPELQKPDVRIASNDSQILSQIVDQASVLLDEGKSEMVLNLKPDHLGKLELKVVTERGHVAAVFTAESLQVKETIEANMQLLKDTLEKQGLIVQGFSVSVSRESEQGFKEDTADFLAQRQAKVKPVRTLRQAEEFAAKEVSRHTGVMSSGTKINFLA